ncbi:MAG: hypothetical protein HKP58_07255, partial [Desulfatitalea sp.]|nr:hypothetical protein [Desulfatitalea sp.]NNK00195.1 hypothetical protein [Desulfatitalea sp.]
MIACPNCRQIQPTEDINTGRLTPCPHCRTVLRIDAFNALLRRNADEAQPQVVFEQGQAECYYHPGKAAVTPCDGCGRLLCSLCQVELDGDNLCMTCLQAAKDKGTSSNLQQKRTRFDTIALH